MERIERLLWSIALPGFGQFLNGHYLKGIILLLLEFIINVRSNLNEAIILSFHGKIQLAIDQTDYQWLMFYPCVYMFGIWDAYKGDTLESQFTFIPFVISAFFATVGLIFSPTLQMFGVLFGPVWLTMIFCFIGLGVGWIIKKVLGTRTVKEVETSRED
ncbi:hypothetical protein P8825_22030 [Shouchella clausii]|uniref:Uncharacterized protein n=1 Tax=Paenibacillus campinasensis TaxID=66347 RepID=A0ABW9T6K0_9BACL|nr:MULTISPECIES: hypothetical protein [Bacillales]MEB5482243.1 hypothetical protein [Shouchella clausii]MUG68021.1 hypothetical protein [Paenibacillus campinasensis]MUG68027.1 hypothetical protein [Paenibacillus campinasensis]